jgi:hypothetical protein
VLPGGGKATNSLAHAGFFALQDTTPTLAIAVAMSRTAPRVRHVGSIIADPSPPAVRSDGAPVGGQYRLQQADNRRIPGRSRPSKMLKTVENR